MVRPLSPWSSSGRSPQAEARRGCWLMAVTAAFLAFGLPGTALGATRLSPVSYKSQDGHTETVGPRRGYRRGVGAVQWDG